MSDKTSCIKVEKVNKVFWIPKKVSGLFPKLKNLFVRAKENKQIIKDLSFEIYDGEVVGYIGENGAGKSTTIKMLTGIYPPTSGKISCLGLNPFEDRIKYTEDIGVVFGGKSLLSWDIAPKYSLMLQASIYNIDDETANKRILSFAKKLKVDHLLNIPVRKLSLGERTKFEIIASLLHKPKIIFLDEPTIGLDLLAREQVIKFLRKVNEKEKTTILLTTHNMDDIEEICSRIIMIDNGKKIYDGSLEKLKEQYANWKRITIDYTKKKANLNSRKLEVLEKDDTYLVLKCPNTILRETIDYVLESFEIVDLKIEEPDLKEIVKKIYVDGYVDAKKP